ncbi:GNAT family N-acetyltransferase [Sphingomonas sp. 37zxx]|uniref:GNAT family N-acetyltransferase n=1 Tax=Sphingomonas sp. 37zxx TaxID=1550073 RepID=UPI00053BF9FA|nr:GNAT family N-acetyltransferase [Sphingomonas sp. 37zxx]
MIDWRDAGPTDADALVTLARDSFTETFGHLYRPQDLAAFLAGHTHEGWTAELADPTYAVRIGEVEGRAVAYAKLAPPKLPIEPRGPAIELRQFYLLKPWHGQGHADTLMAWVIATARARAASEIFLSVFIDNHRARRFYQRYGFIEAGRYAFMVGDHADEDILMRLPL